MRCGLYGKLPTKRDFIAIGSPREFLSVWEPWIQGGIAASRQSLGESWQQAFLTAPLWRFWLGADLCGTPVIGAFMPSLDGVGRYFPLTLFVCADPGEAIPPPELDPQADWFAAAEDFLLSTLEHETSFEAVTAGLEALALPAAQVPVISPDELIRIDNGMVGRVSGRALADVLGAIRLADHPRAYAGLSVWWTIGGEGYEPLAITTHRMPDPFLFTQMLTGRFAFGFA